MLYSQGEKRKKKARKSESIVRFRANKKAKDKTPESSSTAVAGRGAATTAVRERAQFRHPRPCRDFTLYPH